MFSGSLAAFEEKQYRRTAFLNKQTLRIAAVGFFVAFIISLFQSISFGQAQIALDNGEFVIILVIGIIVALIGILLLDSTIYSWFLQVIIPWMWYDKKKGMTYDLVVESSFFAANFNEDYVLLASVWFKVPSQLTKYRYKLNEGVTIQQVSGELTASEMSMVEGVNAPGPRVKTAGRSDEGAKLLRRACKSPRADKFHNIEITGVFEDRTSGKRARWQLRNVKLMSETSAKTFSFTAIAHKIDN